MSANYVFCPTGVWTYVSNQPAPFGFIYVWNRGGLVTGVKWRRFFDNPPFYWEGTASIPPGKNTWPCMPAFANSWWFMPTLGPATIMMS